MTEKKEYPEEIYTEKMNQHGVWTCRLPDTADVEKAYDLGLRDGAKQSDPLAGFSNLTRAIQDGTSIDWEKLDGRLAKCVHPEIGTLTHKMVRDKSRDLESHEGWWWPYSFQRTWVEAFTRGWRGEKGWSLWVEGEIPVKTRTAEELAPGTCFRARNEDRGVTAKYSRAQVIERAYDGKKVVLCYDSTLRNVINIFSNPEEVEVIEVYGIGTLQAPKEEA